MFSAAQHFHQLTTKVPRAQKANQSQSSPSPRLFPFNAAAKCIIGLLFLFYLLDTMTAASSFLPYCSHRWAAIFLFPLGCCFSFGPTLLGPIRLVALDFHWGLAILVAGFCHLFWSVSRLELRISEFPRRDLNLLQLGFLCGLIK